MEITSKKARFLIALLLIVLGVVGTIWSGILIWIMWNLSHFGEHKAPFLEFITCPPTLIGFVTLIGSLA